MQVACSLLYDRTGSTIWLFPRMGLRFIMARINMVVGVDKCTSQ